MYVTIVVDNLCGSSRLLGEHGLSIFIQTPRGKVLLDTGRGWALEHNAAALKIGVEDIDQLVISHGHYDHTWGLPDLLSKRPDLPVWGHPAFDTSHYSLNNGKGRFIGTTIRKDVIDFHPVVKTTRIMDNIWAISVSAAERDRKFIPTNKGLVIRKENRWIRDPLEDDISLVLRGSFGYSVIFGCAHSGIVNIISAASRAFNTTDFYALIGGMHLNGESEGSLSSTLNAMENRFTVSRWLPCHCTGFSAATKMAERFSAVQWAASGTSVEI